MVKTLHAAGIEVILDVVYNHTVEGECAALCVGSLAEQRGVRWCREVCQLGTQRLLSTLPCPIVTTVCECMKRPAAAHHKPSSATPTPTPARFNPPRW